MHAKPLNWGVISTGRIAEKFCSDMRFASNGKIAAVAARNMADAYTFAKKHSIDTAYEGYQCLFEDPNIDVVYIATPHNFHFENTKAALEAGKSVLCEKPITVSSEECKTLHALAQDQGLFLMEAMWTYFLPPVQKAKQWVNEGKIGNIKHIKADFGYAVPFDNGGRMYNPKLAGGCLLDMGIYPLAIAHYFNPEPLSELKILAQQAQSGVDDDISLLAKSGEITLSLASSFQCRLQNAALIIGDKGYIKIPDFWRAQSCDLYQADKLVNEYVDAGESIGYCHEAQAVGEAIINKQTEHPDMPLSTSLALQEKIEQVRALFNFNTDL